MEKQIKYFRYQKQKLIKNAFISTLLFAQFSFAMLNFEFFKCIDSNLNDLIEFSNEYKMFRANMKFDYKS